MMTSSCGSAEVFLAMKVTLPAFTLEVPVILKEVRVSVALAVDDAASAGAATATTAALISLLRREMSGIRERSEELRGGRAGQTLRTPSAAGYGTLGPRPWSRRSVASRTWKTSSPK